MWGGLKHSNAEPLAQLVCLLEASALGRCHFVGTAWAHYSAVGLGGMTVAPPLDMIIHHRMDPPASMWQLCFQPQRRHPTQAVFAADGGTERTAHSMITEIAVMCLCRAGAIGLSWLQGLHLFGGWRACRGAAAHFDLYRHLEDEWLSR